MAEYIPFKRVFVNGFQNNVSAMLAEIPNPRLSDDLIGGTGDMPNYPQPVDLSLHGSFDESVKRLPTDSGSYKNTARIETRWQGSLWTSRQTQSVYHEYLRQKKQWVSFSVMFEDTTDQGEMIFGLGGVGGGSISFRVEDGMMGLTLERLDDNTQTNRMYFRFGEATPMVWHDFVFYVDLSDENDGRFVCWKDGQLARLTHPTTGDMWEIPTTQTSGVQHQFTAYPAKGYINTKVTENGQAVDVLDWKGFTYGGGIEEGVGYRWLVGLYKSGWMRNYNQSNGDILPGTYIEGDPIYIAPDKRIRVAYYNNVQWQPEDTPMGVLPQAVIFRSLDKEGSLPLDSPEDFDFSEDFENPEIISPLNGANVEVGSNIEVITNVESGELDFIVNNNIVESKSEPPYVFNIQNYPIDDSAINISLNGNVKDTSPNGNIIDFINPDDSDYIEGPYPGSFGLSLGNSGTVSQRSYLRISSNDKLQNIQNGFTISFWVKAEVGLNQRLLTNRVSGSNKGIFVQQHSGGRLMFHMGDGVTSDYMYSSNSGSGALVDGDAWNHYAWTYDGNILRCFYNFSQSNSMEFGSVAIDNANPWELNKLINDIAQASYADFRVFDRVFAPEDIEKLTEYNYLGPLNIKIKSGIFESETITINIVEDIDTYNGPYYVNSNGDDNNEGSISEPVKTIGKLNEILADGITNSVNFNRDDVFEDGLEIPTVNDGTSSNPIEFKSYGIGSYPVLSGFKPIDSFVNVSGNIYEVQDDNFPDYIHKVTITGGSQPKGRLPKEGWLRADSNDNNSITSTNLPSVNYSGGQVEAVVWKMQWVQDTVKVTGRTGDTLNYTGGSSYPSSPRTDGRYYIQNAIECLTEQGDWMYDTNTKTLTIYSSVDPNTLSIAYSSEKDGIEGIGNTYNSYSELSLEGSINGVDLEGSNNNTVSGLVISNQANEGIAVRNSANVVVSDNEISDADVRGISFTNTSSSPIVFRNKVSNIALNTGNPLANGDEKGNGIYFSNSENIDCQLNEVINVGFNGIRYNHNNALITRNFIEGFCKTKHDGAGIYTYGGASGANTHTDRVVSRNVVRNGGDPLRPNTYGIYVDDNSENITHSGNLIKNIWNAGHYIHNSHELSYDGDIIYGCGTLFKFGQDGSNELIRDNTISNMVFVLTSKSDFGFEILSNANDISSFFNINNNTYIVASNKQLVFTTRYVSSGKTFFNNVDFEGWQALGNDTDSSIRYLNIPEYSIISEGSNKWNGTVGNYHQDGEVTVNVDGSNVEILMTSQSTTTTRAEIHFRLDGVESDKDYIVRFRARALSGHQSLNLYMRQSNAPYRDLGGKTAAVVGSEWEEFEFLVTDLIAEETAGYLIDCQSDQGTLEIEDFEFVEAVVEKTIYEDYILPVSNTTPSTDNISVGSGWRNLDGEETSSVELDSFESTILLSEDIPAQEYQLTVTYTAGGTAMGSGEYKSGEQVELTATPNSGYSFTGWYRDNTLLSEANPYNYTTRGQADTVQARFELIPIPEFTITVIPSTGGTVSGGGTYEEGQSVTLSAMPQSGWTFVKWSNDATANPYSFTASENLTISAIFEEVNPEVPYIIVKGKFKIV